MGCIKLPLNRKIGIFLIGVLIFFISITFNLFSLKNILLGVYSWHIQQPETIQGGAEVLVLFLLFCFLSLGFRLKPKLSFLSIILLSLLYLKLHSVLFAAILAFVYLEVILNIGRASIKIFFRSSSNEKFDNLFNSFIVGVTIWSFLALLLSLIGIGGFNNLRILTICLFVLSLLSKSVSFLTFELFTMINNKESSFILKVGFIFIWTLVLIQFAKSNTSLDYDSVWYGLRPELVLMGPNSFYDELGLSMFVHYYPKLYELLMIPISNLGDNSFIYAFTTVLFFLMSILIYHFFVTLKIKKEKSVFYTILLVSIPAVSNMSSTAKTDIFTTFLIVLSSFYIFKWLSTYKTEFLVYSISAALLSFGGKPTSYLYIPLIYLGVIVSVFLVMRKKEITQNLFNFKNENNNYTLLIMATSVWLLICYRTYKLVGYPMYPLLGGIWERLGFDLKYPFVMNVELLSQKLTLKETLYHWIKVIFNPNGYTHLVMVWPSNLLFFLVAILLFSFLFTKELRTKVNLGYIVAIIPIFSSLIFYITTIPDGGDGNYFIPPVIICGIICLKLISSINIGNFKIFNLSLLIFLVLHISIMFVSHFSWSWGTSSFNFNFNKSEFDQKHRIESILKAEGVFNVNKYIEDKGDVYINCLGFGNEQVLNEGLKCRFEDIPHINSRYGNPEIIKTEETFLEYLDWANVKYLIIPKESLPEEYTSVMNVVGNYRKNPDTIVIDDERYYLLDIKNVKEYKEFPVSSSKREVVFGKGWYAPEEGNSRWMEKNSELIIYTGEKGGVTIKGIVPDIIKTQKIDIRINNKVHSKEVHAGDFTLELSGLPSNKELKVQIELSDSFVPKEQGLNDDIRNLGVFITTISSD